MKNVSGKVAVITGGAGGIGLGLVEACVEAEMRVAIVDFRQDALDSAVERFRSEGAEVAGFQADVSRWDDVSGVARDVVSAFGHVHYLHNNAGVALLKPMAETSLEEFKWVMDVNYWGVLFGVKAFRPIIEREAEGYISASSSMAGLLGLQGHAAYSSSKFAVIGLMTVLERELRAIRSTIRASVLCPSSVASDILEASNVHRSATIGSDDHRTDSAGGAVVLPPSSESGPSQANRHVFDALMKLIEGVPSRSATEVGREVLQQVLEPRFWIFTESTMVQHVRSQVELSINDGSLNQLS